MYLSYKLIETYKNLNSKIFLYFIMFSCATDCLGIKWGKCEQIENVV